MAYSVDGLLHRCANDLPVTLLEAPTPAVARRSGQPNNAEEDGRGGRADDAPGLDHAGHPARGRIPTWAEDKESRRCTSMMYHFFFAR